MHIFRKQTLIFTSIAFLFIVSFLISQPALAKVTSNIPAATLQKKRQVVFIELEVDRIKNTIVPLSIKKGHSFMPDYKNSSSDWMNIEWVSKAGKTKYSIPLPLEEVYEPLPFDKQHSPPKKLNKFTYPVVVPYEKGSTYTVSKLFTEGNKQVSYSFAFQASLTNESQGNVIIDGSEKLMNITDISSSLSTSNDYLIETIFDGDPTITDPLQTLDIVFLSIDYSGNDAESFRNFTSIETDALLGMTNFTGKEPFSTHKNKIKVRRIFSTSFTTEDGAYRALGALGIPWDQITFVYNQQGRSNASIGGSSNRLYVNPGYDVDALLFTHELGHSFGALLDEYVEYSGTSELYTVGKNCKEDPSENWLENLPGGAYLGCHYYANLYRPEASSLMYYHGPNYDFNAPSKYLLEKAFSAYTENGLALEASPDNIRNYYDTNPNNNYFWSDIWIGVRNLGLAQIQYQGYFSPDVDWILPTDRNLSGTTPDYLTFNLDKNKFTAPGKLNTNLVVNFNSSPPFTKKIPITVYVGTDSTASASLVVTSPTNSTSYQKGAKIPLVVTTTIPNPGWKRIMYNIVYPWYGSDYVRILGSKTIAPYSQEWEVPTNDDFHYGTYDLWAIGVPHFGGEVESNHITFDLAAPASTVCSTYYYQWPFACRNTKNTDICFKGAGDCTSAGLSYCCPLITPSPSPVHSPGDIDGNGSINLSDLSVVLSNFGKSGRSWNTGDFNGDTYVTLSDLTLILSNFGKK